MLFRSFSRLTTSHRYWHTTMCVEVNELIIELGVFLFLPSVADAREESDSVTKSRQECGDETPRHRDTETNPNLSQFSKLLQEIDDIKAITMSNLNHQLDNMDRSAEHQHFDTFLRADVQLLAIENFAMNHTSGAIEQIHDEHVKLTQMVFLSRERRDTGDAKENLGVSSE